MKRDDFVKAIEIFVPRDSVELIWQWIELNPVKLEIKRDRKTKYGDFRTPINRNSAPRISVNGGLNEYSFLITLLHEFAHYKVFKDYKRKKQPHGIEWKKAFQDIILPYFNHGVFPEPLAGVLWKHIRNPRASTHGDAQLYRALAEFDSEEKQQITRLEDIAEGEKFVLNKKVFVKGEKRRTRFMCTEVISGRKYTVSALAEIGVL